MLALNSPRIKINNTVSDYRKSSALNRWLAPSCGIDPTLDRGEDEKILLSTPAFFECPTTVASAVAQRGAKVWLAPVSAHEVIEHLVDGRFLQPA